MNECITKTKRVELSLFQVADILSGFVYPELESGGVDLSSVKFLDSDGEEISDFNFTIVY